MKKYTTEARPPPKNEVWEQEVDGQIFICERPYYLYRKLEIELFSKGFENESQLIFGKDIPFFYDSEGRMWAHSQLYSCEIMKYFINHPAKYIEIMAHKVQTIKNIIKALKDIESSINDDDPETLKENFQNFTRIFRNFNLFFYNLAAILVNLDFLLRGTLKNNSVGYQNLSRLFTQ